jgi:DNA adenine methylase
MIKSPLRYPGGKSRAIPFLKNFIPEFDSLREVFFGGGSFSFYCAQHFKEKIYEASDLNYELWCFWSQLKHNAEALIKGVQEIYDQYKVAQHERKTGKKLFEILLERRNDNLSELQRAIDFFILNRITFSGVVDSGGFSQGSFEGRFTQSAIDRLNSTVPIIQSIDFYCKDYSYLIEKAGDNIFLFLDPPYYTAAKSKLYGRKGILHTQFDHELLFKSLQAANHKWLITYDNSDYIKKLYKDFYQVEWKLQYGMTNANNSASVLGSEILISNYDIERIGKHNSIPKKAGKVHLYS